MKRILLLALLVVSTVRAATVNWQSDELGTLIEGCLQDGDTNSLQTDVKRKLGVFLERPPQIDSYDDGPGAALARPDQDWMLRELGHSIMANAGAIKGGLPSVSRFSKPHRLGQLFESMLPYWPGADPPKSFKTLLPLITQDWLEAAEHCGAYHFVHSVRLLRGKINEIVRDYQKTENETGLLALGATLGIYPEIADQVRPDEFTSRTLAILLAGGFNNNFKESSIAMLDRICRKWSTRHPGLDEEIKQHILSGK